MNKEEDKYLLEKLIAVLSKHCGETGLNEGALETLQRLSEIVNRLNERLEQCKTFMEPHDDDFNYFYDLEKELQKTKNGDK